MVGLGYWGPNLVRNLAELADVRRSSAVCDLAAGAARRARAPLPRRVSARRASRSMLADADARRRGDRDAGLHALSRSRWPRSRRASTSSSRSRSPHRRERSSELIDARRAERPRADAGPHVPLQPAGDDDQGLIDSRRARRDLLHLLEPREPRPAPARRQRRLGPRPARLLDPPLLARRAARSRSPPSAAAASCPDVPDVAFINLALRRRGRSRMSSSPGSRRASFAGRRSSARRRWSSTTTRATSRSGSSTPARASRSGDVRRVPAQLPHGRHRLAAGSRRPSRSRSSSPTSARRSWTATRRAPRRAIGLDVVADDRGRRPVARSRWSSRSRSATPRGPDTLAESLQARIERLQACSHAGRERTQPAARISRHGHSRRRACRPDRGLRPRPPRATRGGLRGGRQRRRHREDHRVQRLPLRSRRPSLLHEAQRRSTALAGHARRGVPDPPAAVAHLLRRQVLQVPDHGEGRRRRAWACSSPGCARSRTCGQGAARPPRRTRSKSGSPRGSASASTTPSSGSYTEKLWGIPGTEIRSLWAAQRIKNFSLGQAILTMLRLVASTSRPSSRSSTIRGSGRARCGRPSQQTRTATGSPSA